MNRYGGARRAITAALAALVLAVSWPAGGAQASPPFSVTFHAEISDCVSGVSDVGPIDVRVFDRHDVFIETAGDAAVVNHRFQVCFSSFLSPGDTLRAYVSPSNVGDPSVKFTIPSLSLHADRVRDVISGTGVKDSHVTLRVYRCDYASGTESCPLGAKRILSTDHAGHYQKDLTSILDLRGFDLVKVTWTSPHGHTWTRAANVPYVFIAAGSPQMYGSLFPGQHATITVRTHPGGSVLSSVDATGERLTGRFAVDAGVNLTTGLQVVADFASDARVTMPSTHTTYTIEGGNQVIRTHCLPDRGVAISWADGVTSRMADSHGRAHVTLPHGYHLPSASQVSIYCETLAGDVIYRGVDIP